MQHFKRQTFNWVTSSSNLDSQFIWHFLLEALEKKQRKKDQHRENVGYQLSSLSQGEKGRKWYLLHNIRGSQMQLHSQLALTWDHRMPQGQLQTFPVHPTPLSNPSHYSKAMHSEVPSVLMTSSSAPMVSSLNLQYFKKSTAGRSRSSLCKDLETKPKKIQILHKLGIKLQDINLSATQEQCCTSSGVNETLFYKKG